MSGSRIYDWVAERVTYCPKCGHDSSKSFIKSSYKNGGIDIVKGIHFLERCYNCKSEHNKENRISFSEAREIKINAILDDTKI